MRVSCSFIFFALLCIFPFNLPLASPSPKSSSSKKWSQELEASTSVGIDDDEAMISMPPPVPYIKTVPVVEVENERMPLDRLAQKDPVYLQYLASKKPVKLNPTSSPRTQSLARKLAKESFMKVIDPQTLRSILYVRDCSMWEATRIFESPHFNGLALDYLNSLPQFYIKRRLIVPFTAFMRRYEYLDEYDSLFVREVDVNPDTRAIVSTPTASDPDSFSTPFTNLIFAFLKPENLIDPTLDPFFRCLAKHQAAAFARSETLFFHAWLRSGPEAWKFIKIYFSESGSSTQSSHLASLLTADEFKDHLDPNFIEFLIAQVPEFNVNVQIPFFANAMGESHLSHLLHILVLEPRLSKGFLCNLLKSPQLDVDTPTGTVVFRCISCDVCYIDKPIAYLAAARANIWAVLHLVADGRAVAKLRLIDFLLFITYHIAVVFFRALINDLCKLFKIARSISVEKEKDHTKVKAADVSTNETSNK